MAVGFWEGMVCDLTGPGKIRLVLQPVMAILLGIRLGIADANRGRSPFLYRLRLLTEKRNRAAIINESSSEAILPLAVAVILDAILQHVTLGRIQPLAALLVGTLLIGIPFGIMRELANRAWRRIQPTPRERPA
jgi:hypothetical protein